MKTKVALMGEGGVGKTSLVRRFVLNEYSDTYMQTVGTRVSKVELEVPYGPDIEVQMDMSIFDIMGQKGFHDLVQETYYHGAQALMAVCDLTNQESLSALNDWIPAALRITGQVPLYVVVNKKDLQDRRALSDDQIRTFSESFGAPYLYTSALSGEFVEDAFNAMAIEIVDRAFEKEKAALLERGIREKILLLLEKRGALGLRRNQFFEILRATKAEELQKELKGLEADGLVTIMWYGPVDFNAVITARGSRVAKAAPSSWDGV